jgi:hypothetical protein
MDSNPQPSPRKPRGGRRGRKKRLERDKLAALIAENERLKKDLAEATKPK